MDALPRRRHDVRVSIGDDGPVLIRGHRAFVIDILGVEIWKRCDGAASIRRIGTEIAELYQMDVDQVQVDTLDFVRTLEDQGLVTLPES